MEDQSQIKTHVHNAQMESPLIQAKLCDKLSVEMDLNIHQKNVMITMLLMVMGVVQAEQSSQITSVLEELPLAKILALRVLQLQNQIQTKMPEKQNVVMVSSILQKSEMMVTPMTQMDAHQHEQSKVVTLVQEELHLILITEMNVQTENLLMLPVQHEK